MVYIVCADNIVRGIFPTRALAEAAGAPGGTVHAHSATLPAWAEPGCYISDGGVLSIDPPISDVEQLQRHVRRVRRKLLAWTDALPDLSPPHSAAHRDLVRDFFSYADEGLYLVVHSTSYPNASKILFCDALGSGARDASEPSEYLAAAGSITDTQAPTGPTVWVAPDQHGAWNRVDLSRSVRTSSGIPALSGTIPTGTLDTDTWIDSLS